MIVVPVAGWVVGTLVPRGRSSAMTVSSGVTSAAALLWMANLLAGNFGPSVSVSAGNWLEIASPEVLAVSLSFRATQSSILLVLAASMIVLLKPFSSCWSESDDETRRPADLMTLYPLSIIAILATDLVVVVSIWAIIDIYVFSLPSCTAGSVHACRRRATTVAILSSSGALLLLATLMAMARFGTASLPEIISRSARDGRVDTPTVVSGLTVLLAAAIAVRGAFFPAIVWPRSHVESRPRDAAIIVLLAGILPAVSLAVAILPFREFSAADGCLLLGMLGVLTCLAATGIALVQTDSGGTCALLFVGAAGLSAAALTTDHPSAGEVAACTLFAQTVAIFALRKTAGLARRGPAFVVALVVAASGIGGGNAILSLVEASQSGNANPNGQVHLPGDGSLHLLWWGVVAGQILWGLAIAQMTSLQRRADHSERRQGSHGDSSVSRRKEAVLVTIVAGFALGTCVLPLGSFREAAPEPSIRLLSFGAATPACLLGVVSGWLLAQSTDSIRRRITGCFDSLARLSREWFYLEDAVRYGMALPVCGLVLFLEGTAEEGWKQNPIRLADSLEHLRRQPAIYYGITGVLLVVGLLWSLR